MRFCQSCLVLRTAIAPYAAGQRATGLRRPLPSVWHMYCTLSPYGRGDSPSRPAFPGKGVRPVPLDDMTDVLALVSHTIVRGNTSVRKRTASARCRSQERGDQGGDEACLRISDFDLNDDSGTAAMYHQRFSGEHAAVGIAQQIDRQL